MPHLIFIWIGDSIPDWAKCALRINAKLSKCNLTLLCNRSVGEMSDLCNQFFLEDFYTPPNFIKKWGGKIPNDFRDGFWIKTSERFLILNQFMRKSNLGEAFHAELDNLVFDLTSLNSYLNQIGRGFFCPRDHITRGVASLTYINNLDSLDLLQDFFESSNLEIMNDMTALGQLLNTNTKSFISLPTENIFSENLKWSTPSHTRLGGIFDAAAIGQFLMGIDIRNSYLPTFNGFVNENSGCNLNKLLFQWNAHDLSLSINNPFTKLSAKIYNLHIHSKNFYLIEHGKLPNIISKINRGGKTCIGWKPPFIKKPFFIK